MRFPQLADLRRIRREQGLRLIDLEEIVGCHRTTLGRWERGDDYPDLANLQDWCQALGVDLSISVAHRAV